MGLRDRLLVFFCVLFLATLPLCHAQISIRPAPKPTPQAQPGLAGTWVLKSLALASGDTLTDGMKVWLENTQLVIEGENSGRILTRFNTEYNDPGKPVVKCQVTTIRSFTISHVEGHSFIHEAAGTATPSPKCSPYPTQMKPSDPDTYMFDLAGDTLTTFDFGGGDGIVIYTYARAKPGFIQFKSLSSH